MTKLLPFVSAILCLSVVVLPERNSYASADHSSWCFILYDGADKNNIVEFKFQNVEGLIQYSTLAPGAQQWSGWATPQAWATTQNNAYLDLRFRVSDISAWQYLDSATKVEYRSDGKGTNMVDIYWDGSATLHLEAKDYVKDSRPTSAVPIPNSALLLGSVLLGVAGLSVRTHLSTRTKFFNKTNCSP